MGRPYAQGKEGASSDLELVGVGSPRETPSSDPDLRPDNALVGSRSMTDATTLHAPAVARDRDGLAAFAAGLRDLAFWPGDAGYDDACRIWNGMIERRPALVVPPQDADQVVACVGFVRDRGLPLSIRGGGHNIAGT